jgi:LysR family hydrogen peroxide-inducible transcriptional activator
MNIRDLQYVVAVAEEGHFGRAANKCHVSQPALSGQIRKLEDYLGVTLFERTNRSVRITPVGADIAAQAQRLITLSDEIVATAQASQDPLSGQFRLGMIPTIGPYLSPLILPALRRQLPNLTVTLIEGFTHDLERRLLDGELDIAILATTPGNGKLDERNLYHEPFQLALPPKHKLAQSSKVAIQSLDVGEMLLLSEGHCLRDQMLDVCNAKSTGDTPNTRETSLETIVALVAAGDGITLVPALAFRPNEGDMGVARREIAEGAGRLVRLVYRSTFPRAALVDRLATIIRDQVPPDKVQTDV